MIQAKYFHALNISDAESQWSDKILAISWPVSLTPLLSNKVLMGKAFDQGVADV
jgi:hypothetical protein